MEVISACVSGVYVAEVDVVVELFCVCEGLVRDYVGGVEFELDFC